MIEESITALLSSEGDKFFSLCKYAAEADTRENVTNRKFLGRLNLEALWMEETLDRHGAVHNIKWFPFREAIAAIKLISSACFSLVHLEIAVMTYKLLKIDADFTGDIKTTLDVFYISIKKTAGEILKLSNQFKINPKVTKLDKSFFKEIKITGILDPDRKPRLEKNAHHKAVYLATAFLNLSSEVQIIETVHCMKNKSLRDCIPNIISEEKLRLLKVNFHNLQSVYDTYLQKTDLEEEDADLITLRGHISIIFHLLSSATDLSHYFERHLLGTDNEEKHNLEMIITFFIHYTHKYFKAAKNMCKKLIGQYAEKGVIKLPIPEYRGFHVRPSTLISKIVIHYGSNVTMKIDDEEYDASNPLELFRVNEKINSLKRRYINQLVAPKSILADLNKSNLENWPRKVQLTLLELMDEGKIILYENNLSLDGIEPEGDESPKEFFKKTLSIFLASGKIDIHSDTKVIFEGDKRVLQDLKILSENGYGEDRYGNNIMLPPELPYLKR